MSPIPLMLPGQAAAPTGPVDMTMMYVMHHAFRRDVRDFRRAVESLALEDRERWALLAERWDFFVGELHQHHTKEDDILWPLLLERVRAAGDAESERVLEEMEAEHAVLDPLLTAASIAMARLAREAQPQAREVLHDTLLELGSALDLHLGHEERDAIEIVQRYIGGPEWERLEKEKFRGKQSLGRARVFVPWALKDLPAEAQQRVLALGGRPLRVLHAVSRGRFLAHEDRVFAPA